ncbi:unnamed protein product [Dracunculus medinensis]|uniref:Cytochrome c oxidase subunit 1 n=1 Tax=Dracunculus medinensis TaxID=318479 RepID=A0A0N4UBR5_DRAME|nr:unnamed protein product [Dracunculus medinensis]
MIFGSWSGVVDAANANIFDVSFVYNSCGTNWNVCSPLNASGYPGYPGSAVDLAIFSSHCSGVAFVFVCLDCFCYCFFLVLTLPVSAGPMLLMDCNLFWFFGYPEVYISILPAFGIFGQSNFRDYFSAATMVIAVSTGVKIVCCCDVFGCFVQLCRNLKYLKYQLYRTFRGLICGWNTI